MIFNNVKLSSTLVINGVLIVGCFVNSTSKCKFTQSVCKSTLLEF